MNDEDLLRYGRHIMLAEVDYAGQERLRAARVLIVGLGGLGSPVALYLASAGVGELVLADFDRVDLSNLQRQIAHDTAAIGHLKTESAAQRLRAINPAVSIRQISERLTDENLAATVQSVDLVCDCSDNFALRFALNAACMAAGTPYSRSASKRARGNDLPSER